MNHTLICIRLEDSPLATALQEYLSRISNVTLLSEDDDVTNAHVLIHDGKQEIRVWPPFVELHIHVQQHPDNHPCIVTCAEIVEGENLFEQIIAKLRF